MRNLLAVLVCGFCVQPTMADLVFSIDSIVITAGNTASVGVYVAGTAGEGLDAYDLPIDIGSDGRGFPTEITGFTGTDFVSEVNTFTSDVVVTGTGALPSPPFVQNYEAVFSDSGPQITLSSTPTHLFDILLTTSPSFSGVVPVSITSTTSTPNLFNIVSSAGTFTDSNASGLSVLPGSLTVIPEPSSFLFLSLVFGGCLGARKGRSAFGWVKRLWA